MYTEGEYLEKNPTWHIEDSKWKAEQIHKMLCKHQLCPDSVCEVGCGAGHILEELSHKMQNTRSFSGYDISPQAIDLCNNINNQKICFHKKDLLEEDYISFDAVMAIDVFEHVEDYFGFLRKLKSKGKYKVFHIPLDLSALTVLQNKPILAWRKSLGHIHYFTKDTALATLRDTGYKIIDTFYASRAHDIPLFSIKSKLAKIIRTACFKVNPDLAVRLFGRYSILVLAE